MRETCEGKVSSKRRFCSEVVRESCEEELLGMVVTVGSKEWL